MKVSRLVKFFLMLVMILGTVVALLPTLASTNWGRKQVVQLLNRTIPGKIEIQNLDLSWGKGQTIEGIALKDPEGALICEIKKFATEATLWQLMNKSTHLGYTQIEAFNANIKNDENGRTNLERSLGISHNFSIHLPPSTILLSDLNADLYLFGNERPLFAQIKGLTQQDNLKGSFEVNLSLDGLQISSWKNLKEDAQKFLSVEKSKNAQVQAKIVNFPVGLMDLLIALKKPQLNGICHSFLGDRLDLTINKEGSTEGLALNIKAQSPKMNGEMKGKVVNGLFTMEDSASFQFHFSPELFHLIFPKHCHLLAQSEINLNLSSLTFPINILNSESTIDSSQLGFDGEFFLPETQMKTDLHDKINILNAHIRFLSLIGQKDIQLQIMAQAKEEKESLDILFDMKMNKPKKLTSFLDELQSLNLSSKISHLPLRLIPSLRDHPEWIEQLGSYSDLQIAITPKENDRWEGTVSLHTPQVALTNAQFHIGKEIKLKSPAKLDWKGSAESFNLLLSTDKLTLDQSCSLHLILKEFQMPIDNPNLTQFQLEFAIPQLHYSQLLSWGHLQVKNLNFKVEGQTLTQFKSELKGQISLLTAEDDPSPLLNTPLQFFQSSNWKIGSNGKIEMPSGQLMINNATNSLTLSSRLHSNQILEFLKPIELQYTLTPNGVENLNLLLDKKLPKFQENTTLYLTVDPFQWHLHSFNFSSLKIKGKVKVDQLAFQDISGALPIIKEIAIPWNFDASKNNFLASIKGLAFNQKDAVPSHITGHIQLWPRAGQALAQTKAEVHLNFGGMPTSVFNILFSTPDLSPIVGSIIDLNFKTFYDPSREIGGYWDLKLDSSHFHLDGRFKIDQAVTLLDQEKPPTIRLTLNPESYLYLKNILSINNDTKLASPCTLTGKISQFHIPLKNILLDQSQFHLQFSSSEIHWKDHLLPSIKLEGQISTQNLLDQILFSANIFSASPSLSLHGSLSHLFDRNNQTNNWQEMGLKCNLTGRNLTPQLFQSLLLFNQDQTKKLKAILGESFDLNATCHFQNLNGPINATITGKDGEFLFDGLMKDGILKLNSPLTGSVKMTPQLSQAFLAKNVPVLSSAIGADNPIHFKIESSHFSCPLIPFNLNDIKIGKGTIELGKVHFRNEGDLNSFLSVIHSISDPYLTIWFTPIYFQLDHGKLDLQRIDLLVGNSHTLASWGEINLNQSQADLVVGLGAYSLYKTFGIQGLDKDYMLQIPLHGAKGKMELDKKKMTARISSLLAQSQGGDTGKLLGNILDLALSKNGEIVPPPTTQPFPWEREFHPSLPSTHSENFSQNSNNNLANQEIDEGKKKKKKHKHKKEKETSKDLGNSALEMLDQLLGK